MDFLPIVGKSTITLKPELHRQFSRTGFFHHFILEVEKYCLEKDIPFNILLLLDSALGHPPFMDDFHLNIKVLPQLETSPCSPQLEETPNSNEDPAQPKANE